MSDSFRSDRKENPRKSQEIAKDFARLFLIELVWCTKECFASVDRLCYQGDHSLNDSGRS
jgi:hypothetical protein